MAKRRAISQKITSDEEIYNLSLPAKWLYVSLLAWSDDFGVMHGSLKAISLNIQFKEPEIRDNVEPLLDEIVQAGLGSLFEYKGKRYFLFKEEAFDTHQSYFINNRTKSEYLNVKAKDREDFRIFLENSRISRKSPAGAYKAKSRKQKAESEKLGGSAEGGETRAGSDNAKSDAKPEPAKANVFVPPSLEEAKAYFVTHDYFDALLEAEKFWNYYTNNGWRVGKNRVKMTYWHLSASNWNISNLQKEKERKGLLQAKDIQPRDPNRYNQKPLQRYKKDGTNN